MTRHSIPADMFDLLYQIGELAGILRDIAAREISENKPIAGTAIDLLARLIVDQVEKGIEFSPHREVSEPAPADQWRTIDPDDIRAVRDDLDGLAGLATGLAGKKAAGLEIDGHAVEALGDLARLARDRLVKAMAA
ncbi:hypothetical protein AruPA_15285 [Acidiphilium sp. PA]|uniref:hypothetical protein n=1 Tax=Acidiphilium sp. PA TaxID=2871705 RepID=UPI0022447042|nr:hypothetical protein [Acidiphilium sp. PA]MCW8308401.1 hypothetical protein [Acidiphilium sp. PA]